MAVTAGTAKVTVDANPKGDSLAFVFKTITDPYVGQLSVFKVLSGTIRADDDKLVLAIQRLQAEDQTLMLTRNAETHQLLLSGIGETHLAVTLERLSRKFGLNIDTDEVKVAYRETISGSAEAEGKLKKQSGGHGQFAVANLRVALLPRGDRFAFVDRIVGGVIPRQYVAAVHKGVEEAMANGGVHGFPVVDVRVECFDGKFHAVDSSEMAFKTAAAIGFKEAVANAGSIVLEPVSKLQVRVPMSLQSDVLSDITVRRGRVHGTLTTDHGEQEIVAYVPTAELLRYAVDLRSMTRGRGSFRVEHDHYDVLPANLVERAKAGR